MLALDPNNSHALLLRGRLAFDAGDFATAIKSLEHVADLDNHAEGLNVLLQAYLQTGQSERSWWHCQQAGLLFITIWAALLPTLMRLWPRGQYETALQVLAANSERMLAGDSTKILETLHSLIGHVRENTASLELLLDLLAKSRRADASC